MLLHGQDPQSSNQDQKTRQMCLESCDKLSQKLWQIVLKAAAHQNGRSKSILKVVKVATHQSKSILKVMKVVAYQNGQIRKCLKNNESCGISNKLSTCRSKVFCNQLSYYVDIYVMT